jgi:hypothetical protein
MGLQRDESVVAEALHHLLSASLIAQRCGVAGGSHGGVPAPGRAICGGRGRPRGSRCIS